MDRNDLLTAARAVFLNGFTAYLDECMRTGEAVLFQRAAAALSIAEQSALRDARAVLLNQPIALKRQLSMVMEHLLNRSFQTAYSTFRPSFGGAAKLDSLSLVDTAVLEDALHIDQLSKKLRHAVEDSLRDLNIRVALLFEQEDIKERENPFRPYLFVRCVVTALENIEVDKEVLPLLAAQLVDSLTNQVAAIYDQLNTLLADHGIAAQLHLKIRKTPLGPATRQIKPQVSEATESAEGDDEGSRLLSRDRIWSSPTREASTRARIDQLLDTIHLPVTQSAQGIASSADAVHVVAAGLQQAGQPAGQTQAMPASRSWLTEAQALGDALRHFFSTVTSADRMAGQPWQAMPADAGDSALRNTAQILQSAATPSDAEAMHGYDGSIRNLIMERRDELSALSSNREEQMVIDVVAMLFEFILRDTQVPAEVRAQLGRLQFLVLKVALQDPALFSQKSHPARMLVNRIGSIVLDLQKLDPGGERVTAEICRIVEILLADESGELALFTRLLDEFDVFVAAELRAADGHIDQAAQALERAENRTLQFARVTSLIAQALTQVKVDDFLHDFLINAWARVVEKAGRSGAHAAMRYRQLVPDIVWSVAPKVNEHDRRELFGLIPGLLATLREGIGMLGWSDGERQKVLDWLVDSHRHALRAGNLPVQPLPRSLIDEIFLPFVLWLEPEPEEHAAHMAMQSGLGLDNTLLDEAIREANVELNVVDRLLDEQQSTLFESAADDHNTMTQTDWSAVHERLRSGVAIEIMLDAEPSRARLNWIGSVDSGMVISIDGMPTPSLISQKTFRRLFMANRIRFLEDAYLFERAVQSLLISADQIDSRAVTA